MLGFYFLSLQEYDPTKHKVTTETNDNSSSSSRQPQASAPVSNYREKYSHLIGGLECAEQTAIKMEPKKVFGYGECVDSSLGSAGDVLRIQPSSLGSWF